MSKQIDSKFFHRLVALALGTVGGVFFVLIFLLGATIKTDPDNILRSVHYDRVLDGIVSLDKKLESSGVFSQNSNGASFQETHEQLHELYDDASGVFYDFLPIVVILSVVLGTLSLLGGWLIWDLTKLKGKQQ